MRLWWWRKVRFANIPKQSRDLFERFGEQLVGNVLVGGFTPRGEELQPIYTDANIRVHAATWLTERGDLRAQREQRLETVERGLLLLTAIGIIVALLHL
jgi:hypothetical protein